MNKCTLKPRIQFRDGKWVCHDNWFVQASGDTPIQAYHKWRSRESLRTRIPRRFMWNARSCRDWYNEGCPPIRYYIGVKQVVAYDRITDEIVLRG